MLHNLTINLADLLFSVSEAMDLSDASLVDHQIRTAFVSSELARAMKLDYGQTERLFVAALLHDIGAMSPEEKIGAHIFEDLRPEMHCKRGGRLFREAFWLEPSARIIDWHHTPMAKHREADRSLSESDVLASQILFLADHLERTIQRETFILHQTEKLCAQMHDLIDHGVHADVIRLFDEVSANEGFWLELVSSSLGRNLRERSLLRSIDLDYEAARSIVSVFKDMTDFRSPFTATHSTGVAACARGIGKAMAFIGKELQQIDMAGLMHDIGKLVVPDAILCKPTGLTSNEYAVIKQHPYYTFRILSRIRGFEKIAEWAGFHHERNDGSGYSMRLKQEELDLGAKIVAIADVATAISESRPYREPGDKAAVLNALRKMSSKGTLEPIIIEALVDNYQSIMVEVLDCQAADKTRYIEYYEVIR